MNKTKLTFFVVLSVLVAFAIAKNASGGVRAAGAHQFTQDPNAYPSLSMNRYNFIRSYYSLLRFLADCYFALVNAVFGLYNAFQPVETVHWENASKLLFISARKAAEMIREGNLKSKDLVSAYIERIREVNPLINGIHLPNFDAALKLAEQYDAQLASMDTSSRQNLSNSLPLFGVPFTSKSNLLTKGFATTSCNLWLLNSSASQVDAPVVARVRAAGAILLGLTTMPNMAMSWACDDSACGQANNPHDSRRVSGGSSSGEGVTIGAAGSLFGIGNDMGGSVRIPAYMNGIFSIKPTNYPGHTLPIEGIVPDFSAYKPSGDMITNGPLCRYAEDLALVLSVMNGSASGKFDIRVDFDQGFRLFYLEDLEILLAEQLHPEQRDAVRKVKKYFENAHNLTVQKADFPLMNRLFELWGLTGWTPNTKSLTTLAAQFPEIYHGLSNDTFFAWEYDILKNFVAPKDAMERDFVASKLTKLRGQLFDLLGMDGVLVTPVWPTAPPFHHMEPFTAFNLLYTQMFNVLGNPALIVPIGRSPLTNTPVSVQLVASPYNEGLLIATARKLEKAFGGWVVPGQQSSEAHCGTDKEEL